jgi:uncharacterized coiled-coil protein SlyX
MKSNLLERKQNPHPSSRVMWRVWPLSIVLLWSAISCLHAQTPVQQDLTQQIQELKEGMTKTQAQLEQSQRQMDEMRQQLARLQEQMLKGGSNATTPTAPIPVPSSAPEIQTPSEAAAAGIEDLRERLALQESQIATHEQSKVESESKYPVKITGLLLLNGFVNTNQVDMPATPAIAIPGSGSTGLSVRQTVLGFDARGPHLFGAHSYADMRVDFFGSPAVSNSTAIASGYYNTGSTLLRLRTAHAALQWDNTEAYFALDRPIISPDTPSSLTAIAVPALGWSGNLWAWNPEIGVMHDIGLRSSGDLRLQGALIDVGDAPLSPQIGPTGTPPNASERSRWPGLEARVAGLGSKLDDSSHVGIGGYFAPHMDPSGRRYDAWAATLDTHLHLPAHLELTGSFYRGRALGGLGGGAYKDIAYRIDPDSGAYYFRPLNDVGGWAELKEKLNARWEINGAFGIDNVFASDLHRYVVTGGNAYQNIARNRTFTGNVIYSPSSYLLFSLEYRYLLSAPIVGSASGSNVIGLAAGYKF